MRKKATATPHTSALGFWFATKPSASSRARAPILVPSVNPERLAALLRADGSGRLRVVVQRTIEASVECFGVGVDDLLLSFYETAAAEAMAQSCREWGFFEQHQVSLMVRSVLLLRLELFARLGSQPGVSESPLLNVAAGRAIQLPPPGGRLSLDQMLNAAALPVSPAADAVVGVQPPRFLKSSLARGRTNFSPRVPAAVF